MQILKSQYPYIYVHKYFVTYVDYAIGGNSYRYLDLGTYGRGVDVVWIKLYNNVQWVLPASAGLYMQFYPSFNFTSPPQATIGLMGKQHVSVAPVDGKNLLATQNNVAYNATAFNYQRGRQDSSWTLKSCLVSSSAIAMSGLTAGEMFIWVATLKTT